MDKEQALQQFYSSFGIPAYDELTVPEYKYVNGEKLKVEPPYITYSVKDGQINEPVTVYPSIWYPGRSWVAITEKAHEIMDGIDGHIIKYDNGGILLMAGQPNYQRLDSDSDMIRRILLSITMEFLGR